MKLFTISLGYGTATAVAKDVFGVLILITKNPDISSCFLTLDGKLLPSAEIIQYIQEVPGYSVVGTEESIINYHIE